MLNRIRESLDELLNQQEPAIAVGVTGNGADAIERAAGTPPKHDHHAVVNAPAAVEAVDAVTGSVADITQMGTTVIATLTELELCGDLGAARLDHLLDRLHQSGCPNFILDLQNLRLIDSCCLGALVQATNRLATAGGRIALVNPAHSVEQLFRLTRLDRVFPIFKDVMTALRAIERP
jgi:anti-sigma B factor antagonist